MSKTQRRVQAGKAKATKVVKSGNADYVEGMQNLRRGNGAQPHVPATRYVRKSRNNSRLGDNV